MFVKTLSHAQARLHLACVHDLHSMQSIDAGYVFVLRNCISKFYLYTMLFSMIDWGVYHCSGICPAKKGILRCVF